MTAIGLLPADLKDEQLVKLSCACDAQEAIDQLNKLVETDVDERQKKSGRSKRREGLVRSL